MTNQGVRIGELFQSIDHPGSTDRWLVAFAALAAFFATATLLVAGYSFAIGGRTALQGGMIGIMGLIVAGLVPWALHGRAARIRHMDGAGIPFRG